MPKRLLTLTLLALSMIATMPASAQDDEFTFGLVLVGPRNDQGWSQAHYEGGLYVEENVPNATMLVFENLNPDANPDRELRDVVTEMVSEGAELIITSSADFEVETDMVAEDFPEVVFVHISGDHALTGEAPENVGNIFAQMVWGKIISGCAAGLTTETGQIGYLGPLINSETRRLASSAYLGARHCYGTYRDANPDDLNFTVTWIGFWFNIPGVTLDPTEEVNAFFDGGVDVVISGIDTTEAINVAGQLAEEGEDVYALPYDFVDSCDIAPDICLGVPYFHWGPAYVDLVESVMDETWIQSWQWIPPDWDDINNPDTSIVGFLPGDGLDEDNTEILENFIDDLAAYATNPFVPDSIALWVGPLTLQDGTEIAANGQLVNILDVWYLGQLLDGMIGGSE